MANEKQQERIQGQGGATPHDCPNEGAVDLLDFGPCVECDAKRRADEKARAALRKAGREP